MQKSLNNKKQKITKTTTYKNSQIQKTTQTPKLQKIQKYNIAKITTIILQNATQITKNTTQCKNIQIYNKLQQNTTK